MTTKEVFEEIIAEPKWYAGKFSSQYASKLKRKHIEGSLSNITYNNLFRIYGFEQVKMEMQWERK